LFAKEFQRAMRDALMRLLEPPVESMGFELVELEFAQGGGGAVLRLFIDRAAHGASEAVTVDDCVRVSHALSELMDREDPIRGHYSLEVSSPGFDRVLRKRQHFERFVGERVFVELKLAQEGRRRFAGVLRAVSGEDIAVEVDGREYRLPLESIQKARLKPL
jgi:ribosome maturation factor RimP